MTNEVSGLGSAKIGLKAASSPFAISLSTAQSAEEEAIIKVIQKASGYSSDMPPKETIDRKVNSKLDYWATYGGRCVKKQEDMLVIDLAAWAHDLVEDGYTAADIQKMLDR